MLKLKVPFSLCRLAALLLLAVSASSALAVSDALVDDDLPYECPVEEGGISGVLNVRFSFYAPDHDNNQILVLVAPEEDVERWRWMIRECDVVPTLEVKGTDWKFKLGLDATGCFVLTGRMLNSKQRVAVMTPAEAALRFDQYDF